MKQNPEKKQPQHCVSNMRIQGIGQNIRNENCHNDIHYRKIPYSVRMNPLSGNAKHIAIRTEIHGFT